MQGNWQAGNYSKQYVKKLIDGFWLNPEDKEDPEKWHRKIDAILRVTFKENPEDLSDEDWAKRFQEWNYVNRLQQITQAAMLKKVLFEVATEIFKRMGKTKGKGKNG